MREEQEWRRVTSPTGIHHHHPDELLEDYLLGTLRAEDVALMQEHLENCSRCQAELEPLMGAVYALPFGAPEPDVQISDDLWNRIEHSILVSPDAPTPASESNVRSLPPVRMRPGQRMFIAAVILLLILGGALLQRTLPLGGNDESDEQQIAIQFTDPNIDATGDLRYLPEEQVFLLDVTGMPEAPEGYVYQAWLIQGDTPIPVGVMNAGTGAFATAGDRDEFEMFCVTLEKGPLGNAAPTSAPILVAPLHEDEKS
jgi:anti-sigma-K factor RskA